MPASTSAALSQNKVTPRDSSTTRPAAPAGLCERLYLLSRLRPPVPANRRSALAWFRRTRDTAVYAEKRTSGFDAIRDNRTKENPRLSDDGIRGKSLLDYDDASDAGVGAGEGATILFHGTDAASAADILTNGVNMGRAAELGGGDAFWTTTSSSDAGWFAAANPAGGPGATLSISVPNSVINNLTSSGLLNAQGSVYLFQPGAASILNSAATFTLVP
jgi:hypothetical protein